MRWRLILLLALPLVLIVGVSMHFGAERVAVCNAELSPVSAEEAARNYAGMARLVPDFQAQYEGAVASWLVTAAFVGPSQVLLHVDGMQWSAELRFTDINDEPTKSPEGKSFVVSHSLSIPIEAQLAIRLVGVWQRVIQHPATRHSSEAMLDGATYLVGVGGEWAYTYAPGCGLPGLFVRTEEELRKAIRAASETERAEKLTKLEELLREAERQLATETIANRTTTY